MWLLIEVTQFHRRRHAKIFGWAKYAADDQSFTSDLGWPISYNIGIEEWDKQKSLCDLCDIQ